MVDLDRIDACRAMTPAEQDLARQLAAHPKWKWGRGMLAICGNRLERVVCTADDGRGLLCGTDTTCPEHYPDLSDAATIGCLIAMLGGDMIWISNSTTVYDKDGSHQEWTVTRGHALGPLRGRTLGEALARAWLAVQGSSRR